MTATTARRAQGVPLPRIWPVRPADVAAAHRWIGFATVSVAPDTATTYHRRDDASGRDVTITR